MRVDPAIDAFRVSVSAQERARLALETALGTWRSGGVAPPFLRELQHYGEGCPFAHCPALHAALGTLAGARALVEPLLRATGAALDAHPLAQVPLRYQLAEGHVVLQLASAGRATLSLIAYGRPAPGKGPESVCFTDQERHEICLGGSASARRVTVSTISTSQVDLKFSSLSLRTGSQFAFLGPRETKVVDRVSGSFTILRLSRRPERPLPSHEYRLRDGALLHRAAGDCRESRDELAMAVLGRMKRRDAVPAILAILEDRAHSDSLRWQALRECLALDSAAGFGALVGIARDRDDPLNGPSRSLRADLCARYPQFAREEVMSCPV